MSVARLTIRQLDPLSQEPEHPTGAPEPVAAIAKGLSAKYCLADLAIWQRAPWDWRWEEAEAGSATGLPAKGEVEGWGWADTW